MFWKLKGWTKFEYYTNVGVKNVAGDPMFIRKVFTFIERHADLTIKRFIISQAYTDSERVIDYETLQPSSKLSWNEKKKAF